MVVEYVQFGGDYQLEWSWAFEQGRATHVPGWVLSRQRSRYSTAVVARVVDWGRTAAGWVLCAVVVWGLVASGLALRERAGLRQFGRYRTRGCGVLVAMALVMIVLLPWPDGGLGRATFLTVRDYQIPALRQLLEVSRFQASIATPGSGEHVLPAEVRAIVRLLERESLTSYRLSPGFADYPFIAQQVVASAWPRRLEPAADAVFLFDAEPVPAGCRRTAVLEGITLARCP